MNFVIRVVLFYLLVALGIESNPGPQTESTRGEAAHLCQIISKSAH